MLLESVFGKVSVLPRGIEALGRVKCNWLWAQRHFHMYPWKPKRLSDLDGYRERPESELSLYSSIKDVLPPTIM